MSEFGKSSWVDKKQLFSSVWIFFSQTLAKGEGHIYTSLPIPPAGKHFVDLHLR